MFIRHLLVPVDFSERSPAAFGYALGFARAVGAQLTVLHVVPGPARVRLRAAAALGQPLPHASEAELLDARERLEALVGGFDHTGVVVRPRVEIGDPAATIVTLTVEERFDLIVLTIHDRGPLAQQLFGSVSAKVVPLVPCPVLLVNGANR
ncbi:MAG TPA: universal stress protein [Polyangia bacterium]|nr:universal stress protein [Polyangia bacterium]